MAADSAAIKSTFFHTEHLLTRHHYSAASTHPCAACDLIITGGVDGYGCDECDFNIHDACLSLPLRVEFDAHPGHELTLTRLGGATTCSRRCDACKEASDVGCYMYLCVACDYAVHPRCRSSFVAQQPPQEQQGEGEGRRRSKTRTAIKVGIFGFRVVDLLTGGLMSPVLTVIGAAVGC